MTLDNRRIEEQWYEVATAHVDADAAATLLEETKSAKLAEMVSAMIADNPGAALNRAEAEVKSSEEWKRWIKGMVDARKHANRLKVKKEYLRMKFSVFINDEANHRSGARV